jgi:hypothetical protein
LPRIFLTWSAAFTPATTGQPINRVAPDEVRAPRGKFWARGPRTSRHAGVMPTGGIRGV